MFTYPTSATSFAGDTASYTIAITPINDFSAKVNLSCSGVLSQGSCSVDPTSVTPTGTEPVTATLRVRTTARVMAPPGFGPKDLLPRSGIGLMPWLLALMLVTMIATARRKRTALVFAALMMVIMVWSACGGGGTTAGVPRGTPAGTYTMTITGVSGSATHSTTVSLTIQ